MSLTLELSEFGVVYDFRELKIVDLKVDPSYQRGETTLVRFIGSQFDPMAFGVLIVARRDDGTYYIVDGLQRTRGAALAGKSKVPALVFRSPGRQFEAEMFRKMNAFRRRVSRLDILRAAVEAKADYAVEILRTVNGCGLELDFRRKNRKPTWPKIQAAGILESIHSAGGVDLLRATLETVGTCWEDQIEALQPELLKGVAQFHRVYTPSLDPDRMREKFAARPAAQIVLDAKALKARQQGRGVLQPIHLCVYDRLRGMYGKKPPVAESNSTP